MSRRLRTRRVAMLGALALALAAAAPLQPFAAGGGGGGRGLHIEPSAKIKAMLAEVNPADMQAWDTALVGFGTRHTLSTQDDPVRGIGAARDYLFAQMSAIAATSGGRMTVEKQSFIQPVSSRIPVPTQITNIIATLHGTQPESTNRMYVVSAHYDSRVTDVLNATSDAPGADDDGSGVSAVLEMAKIMATRQFDATMVFMLVAGEEQGLYGSAFAAAQYRAAGADIEGMASNDIIGTPNGAAPDVVRLYSQGVPDDETPAEAAIRRAVGGEDDGPARQLARYSNEVADNSSTGMHIILVNMRDRYLRASDQVSFLDNGFRAAMRYTEIREDFKHEHQDVRVENGKQFGDLLQFVDWNYVAGVTRVNIATWASLLDAPADPKNVQIDATILTNKTTLLWNANTEPDLDHYEVVWRKTADPTWTSFKNVGLATTATINKSKDLYFFGVRAVDHDGNKSPVVFPTPKF